ncbi:hypothetical protein CHUAL_001670 [Chamberlinius hualienensis]
MEIFILNNKWCGEGTKGKDNDFRNKRWELSCGKEREREWGDMTVGDENIVAVIGSLWERPLRVEGTQHFDTEKTPD